MAEPACAAFQATFVRRPLSCDEAEVLTLSITGRDIVFCDGWGKALREWNHLATLAWINGIMAGDYFTTKSNPFERDMWMACEARDICHA